MAAGLATTKRANGESHLISEAEFQDKLSSVQAEFENEKVRDFAHQALHEIRSAERMLAPLIGRVENGESHYRDPIIEKIEALRAEIFSESRYPVVFSRLILNQLTSFLSPYERRCQKIVEKVSAEQLSLEADDRLFLSQCEEKRSALLFNEQRELHKSEKFKNFLKNVRQLFKEAGASPPSVYFAYAWPTEKNATKEGAVQAFLKRLRKHLLDIGFREDSNTGVYFDRESNQIGENIYEQMRKAETSKFVLLFGTESLLEKHERGVHAVCTELIHILRKRRTDLASNAKRVLPILLTGDIEKSLPQEFERYSTVRDWRESSYVDSFLHLIRRLYELPNRRDYKDRLRNCWKEASGDDSNPTWYQARRKEVESCRRRRDRIGLEAIPYMRFDPSRSNLASLKERLQEHFSADFMIPLFTFRKHGEWPLPFPSSKLYVPQRLIPKAPPEGGEERHFSKEENWFKKPLRRLITAPAGMGKTTYISMLLKSWSEGKALKDFDVVFCIRLRNLNEIFYPNVPNITYRAYDLLQREHRALGIDFQQLLERKDDLEKSLLILDGGDELPLEARTGHLQDAFKELHRLFPHVLVTSRPGRVVVDINEKNELELQGFQDEILGRYFSQFFNAIEKPDLTIPFAFEMSRRPQLKSLMNIPFIASILCCLFEADQKNFRSNESLFGFLDLIITQFYKEFLRRKGIDEDLADRIQLEIHPQLKRLDQALQKLAYYALQKDKVILRTSEIEFELPPELSLRETKSLGVFSIDQSAGSFIHQNFRDYYAAKYIGNLFKNDQDTPERINLIHSQYHRRFFPVLRMAAEYLAYQNEDGFERFLHQLKNGPEDLTHHYQLALLAACHNARPTDVFVKWFIDELEIIPSPKDQGKLIDHTPNLLSHPEMINYFVGKMKDGPGYLLEFLDNVSDTTPLPKEFIQKLIELFFNLGQTEENLGWFLFWEGVGQLLIRTSPVWPKLDPDYEAKLDKIISPESEKDSNLSSWLRVMMIVVKSNYIFPEKIDEKTLAALIEFYTSDCKVTKKAAAELIVDIYRIGTYQREDFIQCLIEILLDTSGEIGDAGNDLSFFIGVASYLTNKTSELSDKVVHRLIKEVQNPNRPESERIMGAIRLGAIFTNREGIEWILPLIKNPEILPSIRKQLVYSLCHVIDNPEHIEPELITACIEILGDDTHHEKARARVCSSLIMLAQHGHALPTIIINSVETFLGSKPHDLLGIIKLLEYLAISTKEELRTQALEKLTGLITETPLAIAALSSVRQHGILGEKVVELIVQQARQNSNPEIRKTALEAMCVFYQQGDEVDQNREGVVALLFNYKSWSSLKSLYNLGATFDQLIENKAQEVLKETYDSDFLEQFVLFLDTLCHGRDLSPTMQELILSLLHQKSLSHRTLGAILGLIAGTKLRLSSDQTRKCFEWFDILLNAENALNTNTLESLTPFLVTFSKKCIEKLEKFMKGLKKKLCIEHLELLKRLISSTEIRIDDVILKGIYEDCAIPGKLRFHAVQALSLQNNHLITTEQAIQALSGVHNSYDMKFIIDSIGTIQERLASRVFENLFQYVMSQETIEKFMQKFSDDAFYVFNKVVQEFNEHNPLTTKISCHLLDAIQASMLQKNFLPHRELVIEICQITGRACYEIKGEIFISD